MKKIIERLSRIKFGTKIRGKRLLIGLMATALMIGLPVITQATPGAKVLITDNPGHKVIEVDPLTNTVVWEYGDGSTATLHYPNEAIPLTNGNILIADTYNGRVIEVKSDTKTIEWQYTAGLERPVDVKKCTDYSNFPPTSTLLITDFGVNKVMEVTYPDGVSIWEVSASSLGLMPGPQLLWEAEKRPGMGTPTYLMTARGAYGYSSKVMEVQRTGSSSGVVTWEYTDLNDPRDTNWTPCGNVLISDTDSGQVIEIKPSFPTGGTVVWSYGPEIYFGETGTFTPYEAMRIENGNTLITGAYYGVDDNRNGKYPPSLLTRIKEVTPTGGMPWIYDSVGTATFVDIDEKGIINIAKIEYQDMNSKAMPKVFAGVVVPIFQPVITQVGTPTIVATKTVTPTGAQKPGTILTYKIELTNIGNGTATSVVVTDQIPHGTRYEDDSDTPESWEFSSDGGATWDGNESNLITHIRWSFDHLAPDHTATLQFKVVIQP